VATMPLTFRRHASPDRRLMELPVCVAMPTSGRRSMQCFSDEGFEKSQTTEQQPPSRTADREFLKLLDSLEVRVDLMAQMQHTRNRIQDKARSVEGERAEDEPEGTAATLDALPQDRSGSGGTGSAGGSAGGSVESRLLGENEELWSQLRQQHDCINRLTGEVQGLRAQLLNLDRPSQAASDRVVSSAVKPLHRLRVRQPQLRVRLLARVPPAAQLKSSSAGNCGRPWPGLREARRTRGS